MSTFGTEDSNIKTMGVVQVKMRSLNNSLAPSVLVVGGIGLSNRGYIYFEALVTPVI